MDTSYFDVNFIIQQNPRQVTRYYSIQLSQKQRATTKNIK